MFKSCFPISNITSDGAEPGDPFASDQTLANYKAVFRHPSGAGNTYTHDGCAYRSLEDTFAGNPDVLFIVVTAPPNVPSQTCNDWADRAREFNDWLRNDWLSGYYAAHPWQYNVAVFDWFSFLSYENCFTGTEMYRPANGDPRASYPVRNMTRSEYRSSATDSHPNAAADQATAEQFAAKPGNFLDAVHTLWAGTGPVPTPAPTTPPEPAPTSTPESNPDLAGAWDYASSSCGTARCRIRAQLQIAINGGTAPVSRVVLYLSDDAELDEEGDLLLAAKKVQKFRWDGQARAKSLNCRTPQGVNPSGMYVIARIDADESVRESNEANNVIVSTPLP